MKRTRTSSTTALIVALAAVASFATACGFSPARDYQLIRSAVFSPSPGDGSVIAIGPAQDRDTWDSDVAFTDAGQSEQTEPVR